jgi:hypothetical protein
VGGENPWAGLNIVSIACRGLATIKINRESTKTRRQLIFS